MSRKRWTRRGMLLALGLLVGIVLTIGAGAAAACKLFLECGTGKSEPFDEDYLRSLSPGPSAVLPAGFDERVIAGRLSFPTDFAFLPDGRILVAEKHGVVRLIKDGRVLTKPFVDVSEHVDTGGYRGLVAVQVDPEYSTNGYLYLLYTYRSSSGGPINDQLLRVTGRGDTADPSTEEAILGVLGDQTCYDLPAGSDCISAEHDHVGGAIAFAKDGTMFVSTGDGGPDRQHPTQLRAQDLDYLGGKILHITREGKGVPSNPFWNGDASANRSKVWAYGVRNPFRITVNPVTGIPYVGDVGQQTLEEIDVASRGVNLGWPCFEGPVHYARFAGTSICKDLYARGAPAVRAPAVVYRHNTAGGGQSVTGGGFYTGTAFPAKYRGAYVYGDWEAGWIRTAHFDASDRLVRGPDPFLTGASGPVAIKEGPGGSLYYIAFNAGELRRITYRAG